MKKITAAILAAMMLLSCVTCGMAEGIETTMRVQWDGAYDVVVISFGGAGAVAAKNAADAGASVLIVEKAPEGHEGGNTKYSGQMFVYGNGNVEDTQSYYRALNGDHTVPEGIFNLYTTKVADMANIVAQEFGLSIEDFADSKEISASNAAMSPEYPELPGSASIELWATHKDGTSDGYLWQVMRQAILDRADSVDVWFESPAVHLIQEPTTKTILGVQVEREGKTLNIKANNGVVMAMGGFENNAEMVEQYLGLSDSAVMGTLYNTGDGVKMAMEVGAKLWHMGVYEGIGGALGAVTAVIPDDQQISTYASYMPPCNSGAIVLVAGDGSRFVNESQSPRHGHVKHGDAWENPAFPQDIYLIMSAENYMTALAYQVALPQDYEYVYTGNTVEELAAAIGADAQTLSKTIYDFNSFAESGEDYAFGRSAESMKAFPAEGSYYAVKMIPAILNTQGGAQRNENAEVLDVNGNAIPHLYSTGEFGGICALQYQGGGNIAECIIFGQIAGQNAAAAKEALPEGLVENVETNMTYLPGAVSDTAAKDYSDVELGENEYIGVGEGGMGGNVVLKVKIVDGQIEAISVIEQNETPGISDPAFATIPQAIIDAQSTAVDACSGCTLSSNAIMKAVQNALEQAE